jgi:rhodanese-related sulfurtransferase
MSQITCEQLYNIWMSEPQLIRILDLRPAHEYEKAHIPGAIRVEADELGLAMQQLEGRLAVLVASESFKNSVQGTLSTYGNYMFLRDCHGWTAMDLPLAGQAVQKILGSRPEPSQALITQSFHDLASQTLSYILADAESGEAVLVDPIPQQRAVYETMIREMKLRIIFVLQTHQHADEWKYAQQLAKEFGAQFARSHAAPGPQLDLRLEDGQELLLGERTLRVMETPGHTACSLSFYLDGRVLTGDTLLVRACGRPAEYPGALEELRSSIQNKLYQLPEETLVLPAQASPGCLSSTIGHEKKSNQGLLWQRT